MRIAQVAPLFESVSTSSVRRLGASLSHGSPSSWFALGHEVTLFASGDSRTNAKLVPVCDRALWRDNQWP